MAHVTHYQRYSKNTQLSPGRARVALDQLLAVAIAMQLNDLARACREGLALAARLVELVAKRRAQRTTRGGGEAKTVDRKMDKLIRALCRRLEDLADSLEDEALGERAAELVEQLFPKGYYAVTSLPYEDELAEVTRIIKVFTEGEAAADVAALELGMLVDRIDRLLPAYAEALELRQLVTAGDVRSARDEMHAATCAVVAFVLFHFRKPEEEEVRARLLAPFDDQYARAAEARKRKGGAVEAGEDGAAIEDLDDALDDEALAEEEALDEAVAGDGPEGEAAEAASEVPASDAGGEPPAEDVPPTLRPIPRG